VPFIAIQVLMIAIVVAFPITVTHYKSGQSNINPADIKIELPTEGGGAGAGPNFSTPAGPNFGTSGGGSAPAGPNFGTGEQTAPPGPNFGAGAAQTPGPNFATPPAQ